MKNKIYSCLFFFALTLVGLSANRQYVPADMSSIATNSFGSVIATTDVCCTQATVQSAFEWVDDNFPTNISKTNVYATQSFVSNNFYLASNPSGFLNAAAASNLFYPRQTNPSNYLQVVYGSNIVDYTIQSQDIASNTITISNIETNYMGMIRIASAKVFAITNTSSGTSNIVNATNSARSRLAKASFIYTTAAKTNTNSDELNFKAAISPDNTNWTIVAQTDILYLNIVGADTTIFFQKADDVSWFIPAGYFYRAYFDPSVNSGSLEAGWTSITTIAESVP